jgi:hypothetical protein
VDYRSLDPEKIIETADVLATRIRERFAGTGLSLVAADLSGVARSTAELSRYLQAPIRGLRVMAWGFTLLLVALIVLAAWNIRTIPIRVENASDLAQGVESLINDLVFGGVAVWFVFTIERRRKRGRALKLISELRSLSHVIDMHQLTKDPHRVQLLLPPTEHSPKPQLTEPELARYLNYCSEMLSIIGKLAALCVQGFDDSPTLAAVDELEDLSSGLSRKMWQKIMILHRVIEPLPGAGARLSSRSS